MHVEDDSSRMVSSSSSKSGCSAEDLIFSGDERYLARGYLYKSVDNKGPLVPPDDRHLPFNFL